MSSFDQLEMLNEHLQNHTQGLVWGNSDYDEAMQKYEETGESRYLIRANKIAEKILRQLEHGDRIDAAMNLAEIEAGY